MVGCAILRECARRGGSTHSHLIREEAMQEPVASQPAQSTEDLCKDGGGTGPFSPRQQLSYCTRVAAAKAQILNRQKYDVPSGLTPDEMSFPVYAASFHKLLE